MKFFNKTRALMCALLLASLAHGMGKGKFLEKGDTKMQARTQDVADEKTIIFYNNTSTNAIFTIRGSAGETGIFGIQVPSQQSKTITLPMLGYLKASGGSIEILSPKQYRIEAATKNDVVDASLDTAYQDQSNKNKYYVTLSEKKTASGPQLILTKNAPTQSESSFERSPRGPRGRGGT